MHYVQQTQLAYA